MLSRREIQVTNVRAESPYPPAWPSKTTGVTSRCRGICVLCCGKWVEARFLGCFAEGVGHRVVSAFVVPCAGRRTIYQKRATVNTTEPSKRSARKLKSVRVHLCSLTMSVAKSSEDRLWCSSESRLTQEKKEHNGAEERETNVPAGTEYE